jgi:3',5'-cyclic AMP phosphodiesterase CpdA
LSIAVISDLHIGDARGADLYPDTAAYVDRRKAPVVTDEQYVEKFAAFVTRNGIEADYLVVPGDVSNGAEAAQVLLGAQVLQRCASALHVPEERILFVPGNHDVNWEMLREDDTTGLYWGLRFAAFTSPSSWFRQLGAMGDPELYEAPYSRSGSLTTFSLLGTTAPGLGAVD